MKRLVMLFLVAATMLTACTTPPRTSATDPGRRVQPSVPVTIAPQGSQISGIPWMLAVMTDGSLRDGGFVLNDEMLDSFISRMHGTIAIKLHIDEPERTTFASVLTALNRLVTSLRNHAPTDGRVAIQLEYTEPMGDHKVR